MKIKKKAYKHKHDKANKQKLLQISNWLNTHLRRLLTVHRYSAERRWKFAMSQQRWL